MPEDGRNGEVRYDPTGSDGRIMSVQENGTEGKPRQGMGHAAKLASLSIVFSLMVVIGSFAVVISNRQATTSTRASTDNLYGPASISSEEKQLTASVAEYPKRYKGRPIPETIYSEAEQSYVAIPVEERKPYIINRIVLYYIYDDVLTTNNIDHAKAPVPVTFAAIEQTVPQLISTMKQEYPQPELFVSEYLEAGRFEF